MPQVFSNGHKLYLIYVLDEEEVPEGLVNELAGPEGAPGYIQFLALTEFEGHTFRFGIANDEVFSGLPFYEQGIGPAQIMGNSQWLAEIKSIHQVHPYYNEARWTDHKHYLLAFKDQILEVIAKGYKTEVFKTSVSRLGQEVLFRMNN